MRGSDSRGLKVLEKMCMIGVTAEQVVVPRTKQTRSSLLAWVVRIQHHRGKFSPTHSKPSSPTVSPIVAFLIYTQYPNLQPIVNRSTPNRWVRPPLAYQKILPAPRR